MLAIQKLDSVFSNLTDSISKFEIDLPAFDFASSPFYETAKDFGDEHLTQIITSLESYNDCIRDGISPGESENTQTEKHFQKFLDKFSLTINRDLLRDMQDGYLIEVYSRTHQQMYRSVNFFKLSSYDLGALTFFPWDKLFSRPEENTQEMLSGIQKVLDENLDNYKANLPVHFLTELCSGRKFGYKLIKVGSVYDQETLAPMGYVSIISVKEVLDSFRVLN